MAIGLASVAKMIWSALTILEGSLEEYLISTALEAIRQDDALIKSIPERINFLPLFLFIWERSLFLRSIN